MHLPERISVTIDDSAADVASVSIRFWATRIELLGCVRSEQDTLVIESAHILKTGPARLTPMLMDRIAQLMMKELGYDSIHLAGAARTSGARRGSTPRPIRFTRRD